MVSFGQIIYQVQELFAVNLYVECVFGFLKMIFSAHLEMIIFLVCLLMQRATKVALNIVKSEILGSVMYFHFLCVVELDLAMFIMVAPVFLKKA